MPVRLKAIPASVSLPSPPRWKVWLFLFLLLATIGVVLTLVLWPDDTPAAGMRFWLLLLGSPALAWALLFGLRLHTYDGELNYAALRNQLRKERLASETRRGQLAIKVIASCYETAMGNTGIDAQLINEGDGFRRIVPPGGAEAVRCSALPDGLHDTAPASARVIALLERLLQGLTEDLQAIPRNVPVHVRLHADAGIDEATLKAAWEQVSRNAIPRAASVSYLESAKGVLVFDEWLDTADAELRRGFLLAVALQLRQRPAELEGEAAAAVLCHVGTRYPARLAEIHRPVMFELDNLQTQYEEALLWGTHPVQSFDALWTSGIDPAFLIRMKSMIDASPFGTSRPEGPQQFDLDAALGQTGVAGSWLAVAAAIERCRKETAPQLVAASNADNHRMLVIAPVQS